MINVYLHRRHKKSIFELILTIIFSLAELAQICSQLQQYWRTVFCKPLFNQLIVIFVYLYIPKILNVFLHDCYIFYNNSYNCIVTWRTTFFNNLNCFALTMYTRLNSSPKTPSPSCSLKPMIFQKWKWKVAASSTSTKIQWKCSSPMAVPQTKLPYGFRRSGT